MRDINRIDEFCTELARIWKEHAQDWRFGQLIVNVLGTCSRDPWFYEEEEMLDVFRQFFKELEPVEEKQDGEEE